MTLFAVLSMRTTVTTRTAVATRTTARLYVVGRLLFKNAVRELVLSCLGVNVEQLNLDVVTFLDTCLLNGLKTLPGNL